MVPEHLRMGLRILRNAGMVPPEIESLREAHALAVCCRPPNVARSRTVRVDAS